MAGRWLVFLVFVLLATPISVAYTGFNTSSNTSVEIPSTLNTYITLNASWTGETSRIYFCQNQTCDYCNATTTTGCFCKSSGDESSPFSCSFLSTKDNTLNYYYAKIDNLTSTETIAGNFFLNHPPGVTMDLNPASIIAGETLTCNYTYDTNDDPYISDSEAATYIEWWKNVRGTSSFFLYDYGPYILHDTYTNFVRDDEIYCMIRVTDSFGLLGSNVSSTITVSNAPPMVSNVNIYSDTSYYYDSNLSCNYTYYDVDEDTEDTPLIEWFIDSIKISEGSNFYSPKNKNDNITCRVTVNDGDLTSDPENTTINIINYNPIATSFTANQSYATIETFSVEFNFTDNDIFSTEGEQMSLFVCNDTSITYVGCVHRDYCSNSKTFNENMSTAISCNVTPQQFELVNNLTLYARVCDSSGACTNATSLILNVSLPPELANVTLYSDNENLMNGNLICDVNAQINGTYEYEWYLIRDGYISQYYAPNTNIMTHGNLLEGDIWYCSVRIHDGIQFSDWYDSNNINITNEYNQEFPYLYNFSYSTQVYKDYMSLNISLAWNDTYAGTYNIYICNSSSINKTGCNQYSYYESRYTAVSQSGIGRTLNISIPLQSYYGNYEAWLMVCNNNGGVGGDWTCTKYSTNSPSINFSNYMINFSVNRRPLINEVYFSKNGERIVSANSSEAIECNVDAIDPESDSLTYQYTIGSTQMYNFTSQNSSIYISPNLLNHNEVFYCSVKVIDGIYVFDEMNITTGSIRISDDGLPKPLIRELIYPETINESSSVGIQINFTDSNSSKKSWIYICNTSNYYPTGCANREFYRSNLLGPGTYNIEFSSVFDTQQTFYVIVCNEATICDSTNFTTRVNHAPIINNFDLLPINVSDTLYGLNCSLNYSDPDGDNALILYSWSFLREGQLYDFMTTTSNLLSYTNIEMNDTWYCNVNVTDSYGLSVYDSDSYLANLPTPTGYAPVITSVVGPGNSTSPSLSGATISFNITFDAFSYPARTYICTTPNIIDTGCWDWPEIGHGSTNSSTISIPYAVPENIDLQDYYIVVCDDDNNCSNIWNDTLYTTNETLNISHIIFGFVNNGTNVLENATVTVNGTGELTDSSGYYEIELTEGNYTFTVFKQGYNISTGNITLSSNVYVNFSLFANMTIDYSNTSNGSSNTTNTTTNTTSNTTNTTDPTIGNTTIGNFTVDLYQIADDIFCNYTYNPNNDSLAEATVYWGWVNDSIDFMTYDELVDSTDISVYWLFYEYNLTNPNISLQLISNELAYYDEEMIINTSVVCFVSGVNSFGNQTDYFTSVPIILNQTYIAEETESWDDWYNYGGSGEGGAYDSAFVYDFAGLDEGLEQEYFEPTGDEFEFDLPPAKSYTPPTTLTQSESTTTENDESGYFEASPEDNLSIERNPYIQYILLSILVLILIGWVVLKIDKPPQVQKGTKQEMLMSTKNADKDLLHTIPSNDPLSKYLNNQRIQQDLNTSNTNNYYGNQ